MILDNILIFNKNYKKKSFNSNTFNLKNYIIFIIVVLLLYYPHYLLAKNYYLKRIKEGYKEYNNIKNNLKHYESLTKLIIYTTFIFFTSNVANTFGIVSILTTSTLSYLIGYMFTYRWQFDINTAFQNKKKTIISLSLILVYLSILLSNFYFAYKNKELKEYFVLFCCVLMMLVGYFFIPNNKIIVKLNTEYEEDIVFIKHLHHWYYGLLFCLLSRYPNLYSQFGFGVFLGLVINGISEYGDEDNIRYKVNYTSTSS